MFVRRNNKISRVQNYNETRRCSDALINCELPSRGRTEGAKTRPPEPCQRGKKSVSDRPLAAESIILIEGGTTIGQGPPRPFIYYRHCDAACRTTATRSDRLCTIRTFLLAHCNASLYVYQSIFMDAVSYTITMT